MLLGSSLALFCSGRQQNLIRPVTFKCLLSFPPMHPPSGENEGRKDELARVWPQCPAGDSLFIFSGCRRKSCEISFFVLVWCRCKVEWVIVSSFLTHYVYCHFNMQCLMSLLSHPRNGHPRWHHWPLEQVSARLPRVADKLSSGHFSTFQRRRKMWWSAGKLVSIDHAESMRA